MLYFGLGRVESCCIEWVEDKVRKRVGQAKKEPSHFLMLLLRACFKTLKFLLVWIMISQVYQLCKLGCRVHIQ